MNITQDIFNHFKMVLVLGFQAKHMDNQGERTTSVALKKESKKHHPEFKAKVRNWGWETLAGNGKDRNGSEIW